MPKIKFLSTAMILLFPLFAMGINVKIENGRLDLDAKNNLGNPVISVHSKLTVSGIKGKDFDLVAIVKDDTGEWHQDSDGNTVKTHYKCNATYDSSVWSDIEVYLKHSKLAPKKGKHTYKVYLYVYYNGDWHGGTYIGSYTQTGSGSSSSQRSSSSGKTTAGTSHTHSSITIQCTFCNGAGTRTCLVCGGTGGFNIVQYLTYPPYSAYYVWTNCTTCGGSKITRCGMCGGTGNITVQHNNNYNNNYNSNYNSTYNNSYNSYNSSSSGSSSAYTTCRICGGSGVCTSCHGTGGEWRDTGYYTGSDVKSWIDCPSCRGNKRCFNCHGTGRQ